MVRVVAISLDTTCWPHHGSWNFQVTGDMSFCQPPMRKSGATLEKPLLCSCRWLSYVVLYSNAGILEAKQTVESLLGNWEVETLKASNSGLWWGMIPPNAGGKKCFYHEHCDSCLGAASNHLFRFQDFEVVRLLQIRSNLTDDEMTLHTVFSLSNVYVDHGIS